MFKKIVRKMERSILFCYKGLLLAMLFVIFFAFFGFAEPELRRFSRTAAISMSIFAVAMICLMKIYGGIPLGVKKSKEIVYPLFIATVITDFITYFQMFIMRYNFEGKNYLLDLGLMAAVIVLQLVCIFAMVYFGHYLYFRINPPSATLVIYGDKDGLVSFVSKVNKYKKQFDIRSICDVEEENLREIIRKHRTIFLYGLDPEKRKEVLEYCYKHNRTTYFPTRLSDIIVRSAHHVMVDDVAVMKSHFTGLSIEQEIVKRITDILISGVGLIVFSPIMLLEALAIKLEDGGPVFFRQPRVTKGGKQFNVLKFRTMIVDADKYKKRLASQNDDRITKVGRVLRKLRIDELPQFINILKGEMSVVGPRPEQAEITEKYIEVLPEFRYRLKVKAGLTGLAQIQGKYNTTPRDKLMLDLLYIEQYSVWVDFKLIFQTLKVLFKSDSTEGVEGDLPITLPEELQETQKPSKE